MANRYWVGGTASWDGTAGTKWSATSGGAGGASVPLTTDAVFFDANSGTGTVTIATGNLGALSINCTGFTGTITGTAALTVSGSITLVSGMSWTHTGTITITTNNATITTAGKTFSALTINAATRTVSLGDALNIGTRTLTVTAGTFTTTASNYSITAGVLSSSGSTTRTIALNNSTVNLSSSTTALSMSTVTGLTFTGSGCTINLTGTGPVLTVGSGVTIPGTVVFASTNRDSNYKTGSSISLGSTFTNLTLQGYATTSSTGIASYSLGGNITVTGTLTCSTTFSWGRVFIYSSVQGTPRTITAAAVSLTDVDFQDITGAGAASWTGTRLGDAKGNSNITFPAPKTVYWGSTSGGRYGASTSWATSIGGATSANNFPLPQDTAVFPSNYPNTGQTITQDIYNYGSVNTSARTNNSLFFQPSGADTYAVFGDLIYGNLVTQNSTMRWLFAGRTSQTFMPSPTDMGAAFDIDTLGGTVILTGNLIASGSSFALINGTFDANGYNVNFGGTVTTSGTATKTLAIGSGTFSVGGSSFSLSTGASVTGNGTISLTRSAGSKTFTVGSVNYSGITLDQGGSGILVISGSGTFKNITNSYGSIGATTIRFTAGTTQTVTDFTASGSLGKVLTLDTTVAGSTATLSKSSGAVSVSYLSIKDNNATGGATWEAVNSTDAGNNTGWTFTAPPVSGNLGNFLLF